MAIMINALLPFSACQRLFRAYGYAIAAEAGLVAMAPLTSVDGTLQELLDGCPVSWDEACAVIEAQPLGVVALDSMDFGDTVARLTTIALDEGEWQMATLPALRSVVFCHPSGVRVAMTADRAFKGVRRHV